MAPVEYVPPGGVSCGVATLTVYVAEATLLTLASGRQAMALMVVVLLRVIGAV